MKTSVLENNSVVPDAVSAPDGVSLQSQALQHIWLVVPCYNDSTRLSKFLPELMHELQDAPVDTNVLVVDDGSVNQEKNAVSRLVAGLQSDFPKLHSPLFEMPNQGKGAAIVQGWDSAEDVDWLGFLDADGAIPAREVKRVLSLVAHRAAEGKKRAFFSARIKMRGRKIERSLSRHLSGRVFATLVGLMIDPGIYDSQCGFKVIPASVCKEIRPLLSEKRFAFDVELLAALNHVGCPVEEIPVDWFDIPGSKVSLLKDSIRMFFAVRQIAKRRLSWGK